MMNFDLCEHGRESVVCGGRAGSDGGRASRRRRTAADHCERERAAASVASHSSGETEATHISVTSLSLQVTQDFLHYVRDRQREEEEGEDQGSSWERHKPPPPYEDEDEIPHVTAEDLVRELTSMMTVSLNGLSSICLDL